MKVDGRKLKKDLKAFLASRFPNQKPVFSVKTEWVGSHPVNEKPVLQIYFTDLGNVPTDGSWKVYEDTSVWVQQWWRENRRNAQASRTEYTYIFGTRRGSKRTCDIECVETILGAFAQ